MAKLISIYDDDFPRKWHVQGLGSIFASATLGDIELKIDIKPISSQSRGAVKSPYKKTIQSLTELVPFVITSDVQINVEWFVHEQSRYESDESSDVDNILKPIIDAISGNSGIIVNDCQIQSIMSSWLDTTGNEYVHIRLKSFDPFAFAKTSLVFIELARNLHFPFDDNLPAEINLSMLEGLLRTFELRSQYIQNGYDYHFIQYVMPVQRVFHRTRLADFQRATAQDYRAALLLR